MAQNRHWEQNKDATVYIGNIDERATDAIIYELMLQAGPVVNVHLPKDRVTQTHQGYGFVEFNGEIDADYASKVMNGIRLYGKPLRVNMASADKQKAPEIGAELFIGNLDPMVDEKVLYDTFSRFGGLVSAPKIARDDHGASKGYGFVSYTDFDSSDDAIANMNGQYLMSKEVSVQYAYKKDGKGERHGDEAERKLAAQAKKHNIVPEVQALPPALVMANPPTPSTMGTPTAPAVQPPLPTGFDTPPNMVAVPPPSAGFGVPPGGPRFNAPPAVPVSGPPRPSAPLPAPPAGLPPRPPPSTGGYGGPAEFHPGGNFRPPPAVPTGFSGLPPNPGLPANPSLPANPNLPAPPSFVAPPGGPGGGPGAPPSGFMPPPGFVAPPPGFRR